VHGALRPPWRIEAPRRGQQCGPLALLEDGERRLASCVDARGHVLHPDDGARLHVGKIAPSAAKEILGRYGTPRSTRLAAGVRTGARSRTKFDGAYLHRPLKDRIARSAS
jgi:hypothetical protein